MYGEREIELAGRIVRAWNPIASRARRLSLGFPTLAALHRGPVIPGFARVEATVCVVYTGETRRNIQLPAEW